MKVIHLRNVRYSTAKKEVFEYFREKKEAYPSDCALDLRLDMQLVGRAVKEIKSEGHLEVID